MLEKVLLRSIYRNMLPTALGFPAGIVTTPFWHRRPEDFRQGCYPIAPSQYIAQKLNIK